MKATAAAVATKADISTATTALSATAGASAATATEIAKTDISYKTWLQTQWRCNSSSSTNSGRNSSIYIISGCNSSSSLNSGCNSSIYISRGCNSRKTRTAIAELQKVNSGSG
jgi:hypothetical protein